MAAAGSRIGAGAMAVLLVVSPVSAQPGGELAARSTASVSVSVSVRPRFVARLARVGDGPGSEAITVHSNFGNRFSVRDDNNARPGPAAAPGTLLIIVPD
jgi:hypothetical protein